MHLVPAERRILDGERVCNAISALGEASEIGAWATRFALLGDRTRLALLVCIARAGPISVTDLAVATNMNDTTVSQSLRLLRASGTVSTRRAGRIIRYELADQFIGALLQHLPQPPAQHRHTAE